MKNLTPKIASPVAITDVTGHEDEYRLDVHGFEFLKQKTAYEGELEGLKSRYSCTEALDEVTAAYYAEMKEFLAGVLAKRK